jgi:hypothetical protein
LTFFFGCDIKKSIIPVGNRRTDMELNKKAMGFTAGILWGLAIFLLTNFMLIIGAQGEIISDLGNFYLGYTFSFVGSLIGLAWGFVVGFIVGWIFAFLYNLFNKKS